MKFWPQSLRVLLFNKRRQLTRIGENGRSGRAPWGRWKLQPVFSCKTNHWAPHEQVPFRDQKPLSAPVGIQMDPSFLLQICCSNQVHTRWPIGGAFASTKLMRGEQGRDTWFKERGERRGVFKREEGENWKKKETRTCHLAWESSFQYQDCGCELGGHRYWDEEFSWCLENPSFHLHWPLSDEENDLGVRRTWSPVLSQSLGSLTWVSHLTFYDTRFHHLIKWS